MWRSVYSCEQLGELIQEARKAAGFKQQDFARRSRMSHTTLSNMEQGKSTSSRNIEKVLQMLGYKLVVVPKSADVIVMEKTNNG